MDFTPARQIADTILYEGYILYPYRASAQKNRLRWQFGVLVPRRHSERTESDPWAMQTECLIEVEAGVVLHLRLRFLQAQLRTIEQALDSEGTRFQPVDSMEIDGERLIAWHEGIEREIAAAFQLKDVLAGERQERFALAENVQQEVRRGANGVVARITRQSLPVSGQITAQAARVAGAPSLVKLRIRVENDQPDGDWRDRNDALQQALIATHLLLGAERGKFVSLLEPEEAAEAASRCVNVHTWPVLVGDRERRNLMISAPIILYDFPQVAPESAGNFYDATEIDELLTLRTLTLTEGEKSEARATDGRAAAVLNRVESLAAQGLERLHGAVRDFRAPEAVRTPGGAPIAVGTCVRLRPRAHGDAQDMFLHGRLATVKRILRDVENQTYLAVILADDPAADLFEWQGRYHYFYPDEVEPVAESPSVAPPSSSGGSRT